MQSAAKVGFFVLAFVACLVGAYATLGRSMFAKPVVKYYAVFENAGGVVTGAPVMLAGVRVGQVGPVKLEGATKAKMTLELEPGVRIPAGTTATIAGSLIGIGDRPIDLIPPETLGGMLDPGATMQGKLTSPLESMAPDSKETLEALNETLKATTALLKDQQLKGQVQDLLASSTKTANEFGALAKSINQTVIQNQGTLQGTLVKASRMMDDLAVATRTVARLAGDGKMEAKINELLTSMNGTMKESGALVSDLRAAVNNPQMRGNMDAIVANTKTMTDSGTRIASNAEVMTQNGITLSAKAIEIAEKASKLADELSAVLKKFDGALGKVAGVTQGGTPFSNIEATIDITRESEPALIRTDFEARIPGKNGEAFYIGMYDAFESNKFIAQAARPLGTNAELRYGIFASKPGVGVNYRIAPGWNLRGDLFDVNDPRFNLRARFDLNQSLSGWLGIEKVFDRNAPSFGISIKR